MRGSDSDSGCGHSATDSERARVRLDAAVEVWCAAQDSVERSVSSTGFANLDHVASVGSSLVRTCHGSVDLFMSAVESARLASHGHPHIVRHWVGNAKKFTGVEQWFAFWYRAPRCVSHNLTAQFACGNHLRVAPHVVAGHQTICADVAHGRVLVFKLSSTSGIRGLPVSPLEVVLKSKFSNIHDLPFARAGDHSSVNDDTIFSSALSCELGQCLGMCCYGCCFCARSTARQLESSFAALT